MVDPQREIVVDQVTKQACAIRVEKRGTKWRVACSCVWGSGGHAGYHPCETAEVFTG